MKELEVFDCVNSSSGFCMLGLRFSSYSRNVDVILDKYDLPLDKDFNYEVFSYCPTCGRCLKDE